MSKCRGCGRTFLIGDYIIYNTLGCYCADHKKCSERENMPNIKITAEVDGKQVPLENISTETFEAIKALEKPKEIPVARLAAYYNNPTRLLLRPTINIELVSGRVYSFDTKYGNKVAEWDVKNDEHCIDRTYKNVQPL